MTNFSLEATFGVIAAAAPSVRPLFGRNAYSESGKRSVPSIPLSSHRPFNPGRSWYRGMDPEEGDFQTLKESGGPTNDEAAETPSDGENSQVKLWENHGGRILKTTDVRVSRDTNAVGVHGAPMPESHSTYDPTELSTPKALRM